jgi:hypothetical protein
VKAWAVFGSALTTAWSVLRTCLRIVWSVCVWAGRPVLAFLSRLASADTRPEWMNRVPGNRFALAGLVALALVAMYGVASFARPAAPVPVRPVRVQVAGTTVVCPDPAGARVSAVTPPGFRGPGRAQVAGTAVSLTTPGTSWSADVKKGAGPYTFGASGSMAAGLTVEQTAANGGLAGTRCPEPATDLWFMGPGPADADDVGLSLTDVDDRPVTVSVDGLSDDGSIETGDGHDVAVGAHATRMVHIGREPDGLGQLAAGVKLIALHVRAVPGRVVAAVRVQRKKGADWLPATAPGTRLVVPGVPSGTGGRRLLIAVPGGDEAAVAVQVMSPDGAYAPAGQPTVQAAALAVTSLDLGLGGKPAGLRLVSNRPIVAALVADQGDDFAVTSATAELGQGGLVADDRDKATLLFTAPGPAAVVRVTQIMTQGPTGTSQDVKVPAGRTVEVAMPPPAGADGYGVTVVPQPGSGPVYAARFLKIKKQGITLLPVAPAHTSAFLPPVADVPIP